MKHRPTPTRRQAICPWAWVYLLAWGTSLRSIVRGTALLTVAAPLLALLLHAGEALPDYDSVHALHVKQDGDDASAERGNTNRCWGNLATAFLAATNNDVIYVHGGEWTYQVPSASANDDAHVDAPLHFWDKIDVTVRFVAPTRISAVNDEGVGTLVSWRNTTNCTWSGDFELIQPGFRDRGTRTNLNATIWFSGRNLDPTITGDSYARFVGGHHALLLVSLGTFPEYPSEAENTEGLSVMNVWFQDIGSTNLIGVGYMDGQCVPPLSRTLVDHCVFTNCIRGVEIHSFFRQVKDVTIQNCQFLNTVEWAVGNVNSSNVTDVRILNNLFQQDKVPHPAAFVHAISINGTNQEVRGNTIRGYFEVGMQVLNVTGGWIQDNVFDGQDQMYAGVRMLLPASRVSFLNNQFTNLTLWGVLSEYSAPQSGLMITGNSFMNASTSSYPAIELRSSLVEDSFIEGNEFADSRFPALSRGLRVTSASNLVAGANQYCNVDSSLNTLLGSPLLLLEDFHHAPPTVELSLVSDKAPLVAPVSIRLAGEITTIYGVRSVTFLVDGKEIVTLDQPPFDYVWSHVPAGTHQVACRAIDVCGQVGESPPQALKVAPANIAPRAQLVSMDSTGGGRWRSRFGRDGFEIPALTSSVPAYAQILTNSSPIFVYAQFSTASPALERVDRDARISSFWLGEPQQAIDVALLDGSPHLVTLYCWDLNNEGRKQQIDVLNPIDGTVLSSQVVESFAEGVYLSWLTEGQVRIQSTSLVGNANGVTSGIFFDSFTTFAQWRNTQFGGSPEGAPDADPDQDGLSNLLEYSLGLPPLSPDPFPWASLEKTPSGFEISYSQPWDVETTVTVEGSRDLTSWSAAQVQVLGTSFNGRTRTVKARLIESDPPAPQGYLRLRVALP